MTDPLRALAKTCLLLVLILTTVSAYLRLEHSGIGCEPWPACYGNIGIAAGTPGVADTYERLLDEARQPLSFATPLHRLVASVLGVLVLVMNMFAWLKRRSRLISLGLLLATVFLAWLGIYSAGLHSPAVVIGNLVGGFTMLGLLGWMVFGNDSGRSHNHGKVRVPAVIAIAILCLQIFLGGLTSANFAAPSCQTLPDCHGSYLPGAELAAAFDLTRTHEVTDSGKVRGGAERAAIHQLHRLVAVLTALAVLMAGTIAVRAGGPASVAGMVAMALVCGEVALGVTAIMSALPIALAVAHNWLAAMLLLALIRLAAVMDR